MRNFKCFALVISLSLMTGLSACGKNAGNEISESENIIEEIQETAEEEVEAEEESVAEELVQKEAVAVEKETQEKPVERDMTPPFEKHGKLSLDGTQLVDMNGEPFQIKGVSTHGLTWFPQYVNKEAFMTIRDEWNANCIRMAMYTGEGGYCSGANKTRMQELVSSGVDYATELGMYVIIDWHILKDNDPNTHVEESMDFFGIMSEKYKDNENVIYEICNEPNSGTDWSSIRKYALQVIPVIRENDPDAIIVVGTPNWSQDVDIAANNPITEYENIMYTIHFYAETHREDLRYKMKVAQNKGLPVFCSEFGICDASGNGNNNTYQADKWISLMDSKGISYCIWNLSNNNESSALIKVGCQKTSYWDEDDLTEEGKWYVGVLGGKAGSSPRVTEAPETNESDNPETDTKESNEAVSGDIQVKVEEDNAWNDGSADYKQLRITLTNKGSDVEQWSVEYTLDGDYEVDQCWGGECKITGRVLKISNVDYNGTIRSNDSISDIGVIIRTK